MNDLAKADANAVAHPPESASSVMQIIERVALDPSIDVSKMEQLLDMQMKIMDRQSEAAFNDALTSAQAEIAKHPVIRNRRNEQTKSDYADLKAVNEVAVPILTRWGINLSFNPEPCEQEGWIRLGYMMSGHGHTRTGSVPFPLDSAGIAGTRNKTDIHAAKSAYTYAQRTLVCLLANIATQDDDGNAAGQQAELITESQAVDIRALAEEVGANVPSMLKWLRAESIEEIPASKFNRVVEMLEKKRRKS